MKDLNSVINYAENIDYFKPENGQKSRMIRIDNRFSDLPNYK